MYYCPLVPFCNTSARRCLLGVERLVLQWCLKLQACRLVSDRSHVMFLRHTRTYSDAEGPSSRTPNDSDRIARRDQNGPSLLPNSTPTVRSLCPPARSVQLPSRRRQLESRQLTAQPCRSSPVPVSFVALVRVSSAPLLLRRRFCPIPTAEKTREPGLEESTAAFDRCLETYRVCTSTGKNDRSSDSRLTANDDIADPSSPPHRSPCGRVAHPRPPPWSADQPHLREAAVRAP